MGRAIGSTLQPDQDTAAGLGQETSLLNSGTLPSGAFHEPGRLRVGDPWSGPRLCEAQRFMWSQCAIVRSWKLSMNRSPSSHPSPPVGEKVPGGRLRGIPGSWLRFTSNSLEVFPSHEPQKVAQASCLFGADRLEACPTLQPAARFMAPTHVQFLEVLAAHEPWWGETPSSPNFCSWEIRARRSLAPPFN